MMYDQTVTLLLTFSEYPLTFLPDQVPYSHGSHPCCVWLWLPLQKNHTPSLRTCPESYGNTSISLHRDVNALQTFQLCVICYCWKHVTLLPLLPCSELYHIQQPPNMQKNTKLLTRTKPNNALFLAKQYCILPHSQSSLLAYNINVIKTDNVLDFTEKSSSKILF